MVSSGLLRRVVLTRATRRNNPEDTILQLDLCYGRILSGLGDELCSTHADDETCIQTINRTAYMDHKCWGRLL
jgi:hypothetical protein